MMQTCIRSLNSFRTVHIRSYQQMKNIQTCTVGKKISSNFSNQQRELNHSLQSSNQTQLLRPSTSWYPSTASFSLTNQPGDNKEEGKSVGIFQRFKNAYKEYGKVLIGVHCVTSAVWFGSFYYAAISGVDVVPLLHKIGASESIIKPFESSGVGNIAVAYLLYKLATPARYTVTIGGTQYTVRALRQLGYMKPVPEGDSLRELMKEGKQQVKDKVDDRKGKMKDKMDDIRDKIADAKVEAKDKMDDIRDKWSETKDEAKDKYKDKVEGIKDKFKDKLSNESSSIKKKIESQKR